MNQHIFAKHHLEKYCSAISVFLGVFQGFNYSDFNTYKIEKEGYNEYRIDMFDPIVKKFTKDFSRIYGNEEIDTFDNNKDYYLFEKFRDTFFEDMFELEFILDNITYIEIINRNKKVLNELIMPLSLISKAMQPYINMVEKIQSNYSYIEELSKTISRFIEIERIDSMLLNDYWLIFDRDLINEIKDNLDNEAFNINKFIVRKYSYNKFEKIKELLDDIKQSECIKEERIPIIESCYTVQMT